MGLVMEFRLVHFRGMRGGSGRGDIRSDGILPQPRRTKMWEGMCKAWEESGAMAA